MEEQGKQPFDFLPDVTSRVVVGIFSFAGIMILLAWVALHEISRMEEFTERFEGRSVESGALLFENNCAECHGQNGEGIAGTAPALNNPHLFGFSFFADVDNQIAAKEAELETLAGSDTERAAQLEQEIAALQAQRTAIEEQLKYDYSAELGALRAELELIDPQLVALASERYEGIGNIQSVIVKYAEIERNIAVLEADSQLLQEIIDEAEAAGTEADPADVERKAEIDSQLEGLDAERAVLKPLYDSRTAIASRMTGFTTLNDAHQAVLRIREEIATLATEEAALTGIEDPNAELRATLEEQLAALPAAPEEGEDPNAEERATLEEQLATLPPAPEGADPDALIAIQAQIDELEDQLTAQETARDTAREDLVSQGLITPYDTERNTRIGELAWPGSLEDLIRTTIISGRPTSSGYWPRPMAAWAQRAGGPLRDDQIENLVAYIINWGADGFTVEDTRRINQYAVIAAAGSSVAAEDAVGTDVDNILVQLSELEANAEGGGFDSSVGQSLFTSLGCAGCHTAGGGVGPDLAGLPGRAAEHAEVDGYESARAYMVTSIVDPSAYIVQPYADGLMTQTFGQTLSLADLSNLIAYLETLE